MNVFGPNLQSFQVPILWLGNTSAQVVWPIQAKETARLQNTHAESGVLYLYEVHFKHDSVMTCNSCLLWVRGSQSFDAAQRIPMILEPHVPARTALDYCST